MAEAKTKEHNDITFSRDRLLDPDTAVADEELHKRVPPVPEEFRSDPAKIGMWPRPEGDMPAVMPADQADSNDYKVETLNEVDRDLRDRELAGAPGDVARGAVAKLIREDPTRDMNEIQAPPSPSAKAAAEGEGALSNPVPVIDANTGKPVTTSLANPRETPQRAPKK